MGEAETGVAGLKLLQKTKPDLAIVDIGLPDIDGIEVVQRFRNALPPESDVSTRFIMLTSYTQERMVLAAFAAGADSYCVKNTKFELLLEAIRTTFEGQSWIDPASLLRERLRQRPYCSQACSASCVAIIGC